MSPSSYGVPDSSEYPSAALVPESGTGMTMSASAGCSRASWRQRLSHGVHVPPPEDRVGPCEVHVFEDALQALGGREGADRVEARVRDDRNLTGRDVALPPGLQQVERARLRGDDPGLAEAAERERAEAVRVADRVHRAGREDQERVGAFHLAERVNDLVLERARRC